MNGRRSTGWGWPVLLVLAGALASACGREPDIASTPGGENELARLDFTLKDMNGQDVRLADFKGRPLLVNFWATWCGPCKHEIPAFVELVEKYKAQKFTVLGISTDDRAEDLRPFAADYKMNYPVLVGLGHDEVLERVRGRVRHSRDAGSSGRTARSFSSIQGPATREWFEKQVKALLTLPEAE